MGLDMYLTRMPRYKEATAHDVRVVEEYLGWKREKNDPNSKYKNCTMKEWCGIDVKKVNKEYVKFYEPFFQVTYGDWDTEHKYPQYRITEEVGYWRKANAIHNWFVENVQDGIDDCDYHNEVTEENLIELKDLCHEVIVSSKMMKAGVSNGISTDENGNTVQHYYEGDVIEDPSVAENLLPTSSGFFFGSTDYDEWYINDLKETIEICDKLLKTTDFETQMIYYCSSW